MISPQRLQALLTASQFKLADYVRAERSILFARPSFQPQLFERLKIHCSGARGEAAIARAEVAVIRGRNTTKGLVESKLLIEIASVPERGWTIIESQGDAVAWEQELAEIGPLEATRLVNEKGFELLAATKEVRTAADNIFALLGRWGNISGVAARLRHEASVNQLVKAKRLATWPGVLQIAKYEALYEIAVLALVLYAPLIGYPLNSEADPLEQMELMWLIQLLVDKIAIASGYHL